jgi:4-aminobutyrate aminotransferase
MRKTTPAQSESDTNSTPARAEWRASYVDASTKAMLDRDATAFLHQSVSTPCLSAIRKAEGIYIEDLAGRRYMDFHGNNVHHVGYGHPRLKRAIADQMDALPFTPRRFTSAPAIELAEKLGQIAPGTLSKVLFTTGGSDAVEVAIKVARAATGRFKTLSFWDAFHGAGFGASSVGGEALFRSGPHGPLMPGAEHVAPFGSFNCPYGAAEAQESGDACARMIDYVLGRDGDFAAFIAEPMRAVPFVAPPGFWQKVRKSCDRTGTLLIFDEIPTGLGKTGTMFSCEHDGVAPDILVLGKGLGGGILPIAAAICRPELDVGGDWAFGHYTHEKNPVTARAALETIAIIEDERLVENAAGVGAAAIRRLQGWMDDIEQIGEVRGRGFLIGIELVENRTTRAPAHALAERTMYAALERGLSFKTTMGNVLTLTPPLVTTPEQMNLALSILREALEHALASRAA